MSWFPKPVGPREALRDLGAFLRQRSREQYLGGAMAILVTTIIVIIFLVDPQTGGDPAPQVVEVQLYAPNRTDADIKADQKKDQARRRAYQAEKQREFKNLANQFGIE
jgi:hypothetical protein